MYPKNLFWLKWASSFLRVGPLVSFCSWPSCSSGAMEGDYRERLYLWLTWCSLCLLGCWCGMSYTAILLLSSERQVTNEWSQPLCHSTFQLQPIIQRYKQQPANTGIDDGSSSQELSNMFGCMSAHHYKCSPQARLHHISDLRLKWNSANSNQTATPANLSMNEQISQTTRKRIASTASAASHCNHYHVHNVSKQILNMMTQCTFEAWWLMPTFG